MSASNPPQSVIADGFGPLVTGMMIQQLLFGILCSQMATYYRYHFSRDSTFYKTIVSTLAILNVVIGCLDFHVLYRSAVLHYGNFDYFDLQDWTMWSEPGLTAIIGGVAQVFFLSRCWQFSRSWSILTGLTLLTLFAIGSGLSVSIAFFQVKRFSQLAFIPTQITLWLVSTSICDIAIAGVLIMYLIKSKTPVKRTDAIISRLMRQSMETSAVTAICAALNFIFYKALPTTAYHLLPQYSMSRIYTMTVIYTLLARTELRELGASRTGTMMTGFIDSGNGPGNGVRVTVDTTTRRDGQTVEFGPHDISLDRVPSKDTMGKTAPSAL